MKIRHLEVADSIWKDKRIPKETKLIYSYIYTKGFERIITDINIAFNNEKVNKNVIMILTNSSYDDMLILKMM